MAPHTVSEKDLFLLEGVVTSQAKRDCQSNRQFGLSGRAGQKCSLRAGLQKMGTWGISGDDPASLVRRGGSLPSDEEVRKIRYGAL